MKNFNRKKFNGFTLVELLVVMAILTLLLVATMAFVGPVQKIFKDTNEAERSHAYADNTKSYIEDSLKYAEGIRIYQELPASSNVQDLVENYFDIMYKDVVTYDGSSLDYAEGVIRVMQLQNSNSGRISVSTYGFSNNHVDSAPSATINALNESYFLNNNGTPNYILKYAIGVNTLENESESGNIFRVLSNDRDNLKIENSNSLTDPGAVSSTRFSISVLASKHEEATKQTNPAGVEYTRFDERSQLVNANIPLLNINNGYGKIVKRFKLKSTCPDLDTAKNAPPADFMTYAEVVNNTNSRFLFNGVNNATDPNPDFLNLDNDIFIIYSYADESNV